MGGGGGGQRDHPVRAKSAGGRTVAAGHAAVRAQPMLGRVTIPVPRSHGKPARTATVEIRALRTTLRPDRAKYPHAWPLTWTLVEVWEPHPAPAGEALHWLLWTQEPATTLTEVQEWSGNIPAAGRSKSIT